MVFRCVIFNTLTGGNSFNFTGNQLIYQTGPGIPFIQLTGVIFGGYTIKGGGGARTLTFKSTIY